jgi:hypothetical protein
MKNYLKLSVASLVVVLLVLLTNCGKESDPIVVAPPPYVGITELGPQFQLQDSTFLVGDTKDIVVRVRNIGDAYSVGSIKLYVSGYSAFSVNFNPNAETANTISGTVDVKNTNCASFKGQDFMYIETPLSIAPGEEINISFTVTAKEANQLNELYVLLQNRSGGDIDSENNEIFKTLSIS